MGGEHFGSRRCENGGAPGAKQAHVAHVAQVAHVAPWRHMATMECQGTAIKTYHNIS